MQQISIFEFIGRIDRTLKNLKCNTNKQEAKKRRALKKGIEVGDIVTIDDDKTEYEVYYFGFSCDDELYACIGNRACQWNWDINSSRVKLKRKKK